MQLKFAFSFPVNDQPFIFHKKPNGRPMNKMKKIKRQGQETLQKTTISNRVQMLRELTSRFVAYRTSVLPFFILKEPALFAIKLVCL